MDYSDISFEQLCDRLVQCDVQALEEILSRFDHYILSQSKIRGEIDEDVAQQVRQAFLIALQQRFWPKEKF